MTDSTKADEDEPLQEVSDQFEEVETTISTDYKVLGEDAIPDGTGILGHNTATTGTAFGVEGVTESADNHAAGTFGEATAGSGWTFGVHGVTQSGHGSAVGVRGLAPVGGADGVVGIARNGGLGIGGTTDSTNQPAGLSWHQATTGEALGHHGFVESSGDGSVGVLGETVQASGQTYGLMGKTESAHVDAAGVYGRADSGVADAVRADSTSGSGHAIRARANSGAGQGYGMWVTNYASSGVAAQAVYAETKSASSAAVVAENDGGGQALQANGWVGIDALGVEAHQTSTISATGSYTTVVYDSEIVDDRNEYDETTGEFTCANNGTYHVEAQIEWGSGMPEGTGLFVEIRVNGSTELRNYQEVPSSKSPGPTQAISKTIRRLSTGDVITIVARHSEGSTTYDLIGAPNYAQLQITQLG